ncbi:TrbI/VirB10 family protein [Acidovorax sp. GBBC 3332]|nr:MULTISPECIES: TrbI/VirB10 family protein [unclassified Acidovorax]MDA8449212.1 TrbI/VirB10 family protein [Acidovorax sp. GBBC 3297]MDA8458700.1 TrbI/VirB10 family protein [Acidovorax sp. GBBC 3333]MDA8463968.1 TrbI/VirB10 family protein [Acidovorax sp. GBBC 3332]MDA8469000.1 TrbI/VirB10 family protein [Acidovorax sp. GBBC 3299]WCM80599.1 TrbI/VirB10 family protein [Acidovorax sp. GBBC 712]
MVQDDLPHAAAAPQPAKVAPEAVALRAQPRAVTRLNRRTLAVLIGGLSAAVLGALMWSLQPQRRAASEQPELYNVDRVAKSEGLDALPKDYSQLPPAAPKVPELGPPLPGDLGPAILKSQQQPAMATYSPPGQDAAAAERDALRKEAEAAAGSSVFFRTGNNRPGTAAVPAAPPAMGASAPPASALAAFDPLAAGPASTAPQATDPAIVQNRQDQKEAFLKSGTSDTHNSGKLQMPASPYQVMAGSVIPAALVTGIRSDLPGDVIGTVTEPVYDTATGRHLLIPQGSRIFGRYNSQVSYGQSRLQVVWHRIILPDTSSLTLDNLVGTDPAGYAGLEDGVDRHWDRLLAGAALTTLLGVGAELAAPENRQDGNRIVIAGRDGVQDSVNQVGQELTRRNLNVQSTLTARPGLPVRIIVNRDLVLRPYQPIFFTNGKPQGASQ